jgi:uncharacterized protein involved in response to NO
MSRRVSCIVRTRKWSAVAASAFAWCGGVELSGPAFFAAPHRVMFLGGAVQALLAMAFWSLANQGGIMPDSGPCRCGRSLRYSGIHLARPADGLGVFPWFVFGFILTAGPRWQGAADLGQKEFLPPFLLLAVGLDAGLAGVALLFPCCSARAAWCLPVGWALVARLLTRIACKPRLGREHIVCVALAAWLGVAAVAAVICAGAQQEIFCGVVLGC